MNPKNGNSIDLSSAPPAEALKKSGSQKKRNQKEYTFDQPVVLRQSPMWAKAIAGTIMAVATFTVIWSATARIEQVVPAQGQLKPEDGVREIKVPINGRAVVRSVEVEDGEIVKEGDLLLTLDTETTEAQLNSLLQQRQSLNLETQFYLAILNNVPIASIRGQLNNLKVSPTYLALAKNRIALIAENNLYQAQLSGNSTNLAPSQINRWRAATEESRSRIAAAQLEVRQLEEQLNSNRIQLRDAQERLTTETGILNELTPLLEAGGIARLQYVRQQQQVQTQRAEVQQLSAEQQRILYDIGQARQELNNARALTSRDILDRKGENEKRIAEIDSQLTARLVENRRRIAELDAQIKQSQVSLDYQQITAPVGGRIFDLQAAPQGVLEANLAETILKIVPGDKLIAEVFVTNKDIGFVAEKYALAKKEGKDLNVDVRIDSFNFSEFGDIDGKVIYIGSDALPPDELNDFYRFPVKIELNKQFLDVSGQKLNLQPGMSITANIRIRENRTVLSIFTDLFNRQIDALKAS